MLERVLLERGREAHDVVSGLRETLAATLERLSGIAPLARADVAAVQGFHAGGLPAIVLDGPRGDVPVSRPWWFAVAPRLAALAVERAIRDRSGHAIAEAVDFHDRQLESWLKVKIARLLELYESEAGAFREQVRRLATGPDGEGSTPGDLALEAELRTLRGTAEAHMQPVPAQPKPAAMAED